MRALGIDTSNYTTSAAVFDGTAGKNAGRLLDVRPGALGLRQSDALFQHVKHLPDRFAELEAEGHSAPAAQTAAEQGQMSLLDVGAAQVADALRRTAVETLTPIEAMNLLYEWKQKL